MRPERKTNGRAKWYVDLDRPNPGGKSFQRIPGVTTLVKNGKPAPNLINWAGDATAEFAINNWAELEALPIADRLAKLKRGRYEKRDAAGDKGTQVHRLAERLLTGEKVIIPEGLEGYVDAAVQFINRFDVRPIAVERLVFSETHYYCGTLDLAADVLIPDDPDFDWIPTDDGGRARGLFDWKTGNSGIWGDLAFQLAPYRFAEATIDTDGELDVPPEVDFGAGIHLRADGTFTVTPVKIDEEQFEGFLAIKKVAELMEVEREFALDPIYAPLGQRYQLTLIGDEGL